MQNSQETAERIKSLAKKQGISISKLLSDCMLNKNAIYTMQTEGYFPRIEAISKIADYLNCSVDYLLGKTDFPTVVDEQLAKEEFALFGEVKELTDEEKQRVLDFIKFTKEQRKDK